jgi:cytosine deaminase
VDLIVRNARLRGREGLFDVGVVGERIAAIEPKLAAQAAKEINANGKLVAPTFIEPHIHLDKVLISEEVPSVKAGTLFEGIEHTWDRKRNYTVGDVAKRAGRVIRWAVQHGTTYIRTHVDVDTIGGLTPVEGLLQARAENAHLCDIQIIAFPQEGILKDPGTEDLMREAMRMGADVVGGMPHNEYTPEECNRHIDICFEIAKEFDADIDMHVDETDNPMSRTLQYLATKTIREGFHRRVTAGHTCALAAYDDPYAAWVIDTVRQAQIHMITNPVTNLMVQGRFDRQPIRRGITRVKELLAAGINVAYGQDCVKDPFYPIFGQADMLEVGMVVAHAAQFNTPQEIETLFDMPTVNSARILRLDNYGLEVGKTASFNIIDAPTVQEAFRTQPDRVVLRKGEVLAETQTSVSLYY